MITAVLTAAAQDAASDAAHYILEPDTVLLLTSDGSARLLDFDGYFYALSATAATMLTETIRCGETAAAKALAARYNDADPTQVRQDLNAFICELEHRRLIYRAGSRPRGWDLRATVSHLALRPALGTIRFFLRNPHSSAWPFLTLAYLSIRLFGWSRAVAAWHRCLQPVDHRDPRPDDHAAAKAIDDAIRAKAARHLLNVSCKERALSCWALLRSADLPAALVLGINLFPLASHAWCELGSWVLTDYEDSASASPRCCAMSRPMLFREQGPEVQVGFAVASRDGEVEFRTFQSKFGTPGGLISFCRTTSHSAVLLGHLYYRDDLANSLRLGPGETSGDLASDAALALALSAWRAILPSSSGTLRHGGSWHAAIPSGAIPYFGQVTDGHVPLPPG